VLADRLDVEVAAGRVDRLGAGGDDLGDLGVTAEEAR
jgi:hypothetical protein